MAAAGCCGRRSGGVFGWGLPALILGTLLGIFSTALNGMQTLNGLFCFVTVRSQSEINEALVSSFVITNYGQHNHYFHSAFACNDPDAFLASDPFLFESCITWTTPDEASNGFACRMHTKGKGVIESYSFSLDVNCTTGLKNSQSFMISLTPGSSSIMGAGNMIGYSTIAVVEVNRCALSQHFYIIFSSVCAAITVTIFIIRAWMRTCLVGLSFRLSHSETFYWAYKYLENYGFFDFANPYRNEPYHLVKGERFYVMRDRSSCIIGDVGDTNSLACTSADSVYKFTYVDGEVFAYCKDRSGFETFTEANVQSSTAAVIKEYLKQKSRSACVTNEGKSHFLSLTECCELAQAGYGGNLRRQLPHVLPELSDAILPICSTCSPVPPDKVIKYLTTIPMALVTCLHRHILELIRRLLLLKEL